MNRNKATFAVQTACLLTGIWMPLATFAFTNTQVRPAFAQNANPPARVVIVHDPEATEAFQPREDKVFGMVNRGLATLTGKQAPVAAWRSLLSTQDIVGIKVYSSPGPNSGTRLAVAAAVVDGLVAAKIPPEHIIVWDKEEEDLRRAGFFELAARYRIRVEASIAAGYDEKAFYDPDEPILGKLLYGDSEFGRTGEGIGRKSFV